MNSFRLCWPFDWSHSSPSSILTCFYIGILECSSSMRDTSLSPSSINWSIRWSGTGRQGSTPACFAPRYSAHSRSLSVRADCTDICCSILHWQTLFCFQGCHWKACSRGRMPRRSRTIWRESRFKMCACLACRLRLWGWYRVGWGQGASNSSLRKNHWLLNHLKDN